MSVNRASEVWKEIKPFAIRDMNSMVEQSKSGSGENLYAIILQDISAQKLRYYSFSTDGLEGALAAASPGDVVQCPGGTLQMDFTVPIGVALVGDSREKSIIWGTVTLSDEASLELMNVLKEDDTASDIAAVVCDSGTARTRNCTCDCFNCGTGDAVGVSVGTGAVAKVEYSQVRGESSLGSGYGVSGVGTVDIKFSLVYGSTALYNGTVTVYANTIAEAAIANHCASYDLDAGYSRFWGQAIDNIRDVSGVTGTPTIVPTGDFKAKYPVKIPGYLYSLAADGTAIYELTISSLAVTTKSLPATSGSEIVVVGERQIAWVANYSDLYVTDFAADTSTKIATLPIIAGTPSDWNYKLIRPMTISGKVYVYVCSFFAIAGNFHFYTFVFNVTDEVLVFSDDQIVGLEIVYSAPQVMHYLGEIYFVFSKKKTSVNSKVYYVPYIRVYNFNTNSITNYDSDLVKDFNVHTISIISGLRIHPTSKIVGFLFYNYQYGGGGDFEYNNISYDINSHAITENIKAYGYVTTPLNAIQGNSDVYSRPAGVVFGAGNIWLIYDIAGDIVISNFFSNDPLVGDAKSSLYDDLENRIWVFMVPEKELRGYNIADDTYRAIDCSAITDSLSAMYLEVYEGYFYLWSLTAERGYIIKP